MKKHCMKPWTLGLLLLGVAVAFTQSARAQFGGATRRTSTSSTSSSYPSATSMGTATYSVNPDSRSVSIVTDDQTAKYISEVISNLNRPAPQVLIKVVFLEASYNKDSDIGVDGMYQHTLSGHDINGSTPISGKVSSVFDLATSGGIYSVLSDDLSITLAALAKAGKTEILSRPSILTRNNQPATISLGQQIPIITSTRYDNYGNQINSFTYQNVGISLQVTPFIGDNGMVEMIVTPTTSQLADRSQWVPIQSGTNGTVSAPVINSRSADTVVVVPDGQTVVIGGLMQKQNTESESKIPLLGDIPLLGNVFKHKVKSTGKTELLIFLTPHIVEFPSQLADLSAKERANAQLSSKSFSGRELENFLDDPGTKGNQSNIRPDNPNQAQARQALRHTMQNNGATMETRDTNGFLHVSPDGGAPY